MKVVRKDVYEFIVMFTEDEFETLQVVSNEYNNTLEDFVLWLVENGLIECHDSLR